VEGIERIESRINDIEARIAAINDLVNSKANPVGWGPGLSGVGQPAPAGLGAASIGSTSLDSSNLNSTINGLTGGTDYSSTIDSTQSPSFADTLAQMQNAQTASLLNNAGVGNISAASVNAATTNSTGLTSAALATGSITPASVSSVSAVSSASSSGVTTATIPAFTPPAELVPYGNGHIPASLLAPIGVGAHRLYAPAASSFKQMSAAASTQGVKIGVTDSYRSFDQQTELAQRKGLYTDGGLAAQPGQSKHGWGMALDVDVDSKGLAWMRANGAKYGFYETTPREPWHWEYRPTTATAA
jgi:D-alanyl-D-alanine carboxypeptidase